MAVASSSRCQGPSGRRPLGKSDSITEIVRARLMVCSHGGLTVDVLGDVLLEKVVERGSNRGDRAQLADVVPRGGDRRADDVGCQLELETEQQPDGETYPNLLAVHDLERTA